MHQLQELKALHKLKPSEEDKWRVFAYTKGALMANVARWTFSHRSLVFSTTAYPCMNVAIKALRFHPTRIRSHAEAVALPGVGNKTAQKVSI